MGFFWLVSDFLIPDALLLEWFPEWDPALGEIMHARCQSIRFLTTVTSGAVQQEASDWFGFPLASLSLVTSALWENIISESPGYTTLLPLRQNTLTHHTTAFQRHSAVKLGLSTNLRFI